MSISYLIAVHDRPAAVIVVLIGLVDNSWMISFVALLVVGYTMDLFSLARGVNSKEKAV